MATPERRVALVTGASRGIGREIALALATAGYDIAVNYAHRADAAEDVADAIRTVGRRALTAKADVSRLDEVKAMVALVRTSLGPVDVLVANAGLTRDNFLTFMTDEEWNEVIDVNLKGAFYCIKVVGRDMLRRKSGKVVVVASDAGLLGDMMRANYAAAKAGLFGLVKTAAREFASAGITVNAVAPGIIETELTADMPVPKRDRQLAGIPMRRFGAPREVAAVVAFLASDDARYMTGQSVCIDGGLHM